MSHKCKTWNGWLLQQGTYLCVCRGARLTQAVALLNRHFQPLVNTIYEFSSQRSGAGIEHSEGAKIVFLDDRMFSEE